MCLADTTHEVLYYVLKRGGSPKMQKKWWKSILTLKLFRSVSKQPTKERKLLISAAQKLKWKVLQKRQSRTIWYKFSASLTHEDKDR